MERPAPTPCIHVCVMDEQRGVCVGCHRTAEEICHWPGGLGGSVFAVTLPSTVDKGESSGTINPSAGA